MPERPPFTGTGCGKRKLLTRAAALAIECGAHPLIYDYPFSIGAGPAARPAPPVPPEERLVRRMNTGSPAPDAIAEAVIAMAAKCAARGWTPATAGNFSARIGGDSIAITRSGADKGALTPADILTLPLGEPPPPHASAEAPVHWALYRHDAAIGAVAHAHAPAATLASLLPEAEHGLKLAGWELLKAIAGQTTHNTEVTVPVLPNTQDMTGLAARFRPRDGAPALILKGHGIYAWGKDTAEAYRHLEALEALCDLELRRRQYGL